MDGEGNSMWASHLRFIGLLQMQRLGEDETVIEKAGVSKNLPGGPISLSRALAVHISITCIDKNTAVIC